jgi:iron complex outermembrane receptor protein
MLRRSAIIVFSALSILSAALWAETLPTYVVTASRTEEDTMSVPDQVTVISEDDIKKSGKTELIDVLSDMAGISFRSYSTGAEAQASMRGFGENSFGRVQVLVDGRSMNNPDMNGINWLSIPLSSIKKIEILDGPSAVLYGSGAVGGVINIITKESSPGVTAEATLAYGSNNTRQALVNAGYATERAGFLLSADIYRTDGFRERTENRDTNVTINGFFDATDKLTLKPYATYSSIYYQMPGGLTKAQYDDDPSVAINQKDDGAEKSLGGGFSALFAATDRLSVELPVSYLHKDRSAAMQSWSSWTDVTQQTFGAKPKVEYSGDYDWGPYRISGGFDFAGALHDATNYSDSKRTVQTYTYDLSQFTYAPWTRTTLSLPHKLALTAGARFDAERIAANKKASNIDESDTASAFVYDIALSYRPIDALSVYAKYNTTFRYPFIDEKAQLTGYGTDTFNKDLDPETGRNAEIGVKYRYGDLLTATANAYWLVMQDEITYNENYLNVNLNETSRLGGSASVGITPIRYLRLDLGASYVHAVFSKDDAANGYDKGDRIPLVPDLTGRAAITGILPMGFTLGSDVTWTGEQAYYVNKKRETQDGYALVGLSFNAAPPAFKDKFSIGARIDNLLDRKYASYIYSSTYYPAEGRSFSISATCRY